MEWIVLKTLLSLVAVIALMIAVVFLMKKFLHGGPAGSHNIVDMKVIGTMMLQPKRSVSLLKVMDKVLIIGISEDGMEALGEICDEKSLRHIETKLAEQPADVKWFIRKKHIHPEGTRHPFAEALSFQISKLTARGS